VPDGLTDEDVLFLADILPTAFEVGVLNGGVQPGDTVAIVGAGPIGLATIMTAKLFTPGHIVAIDRRCSARGARVRGGLDDQQQPRGCEDGDGADRRTGVDVAIQAVGVPGRSSLHLDRAARRSRRERRRAQPLRRST
jgi:alcohol dehydrogenase